MTYFTYGLQSGKYAQGDGQETPCKSQKKQSPSQGGAEWAVIHLPSGVHLTPSQMEGHKLRVADEFEEERAENVYDCPLTSSGRSIVSSIPHRLRLLGAEHAHINVARVWTTMCCIKVLEVQRTCWIWGDGDLCVTPPPCLRRARALSR